MADTVLDTARTYARRGWAVVPIPAREKGPNLKGWESLRLTPDDLPRYFNGRPQNVGVILGEPSGGLVDLDLDTPEAVAAAPYLAPDTAAVFGRPGRPRSHRLYVCQDAHPLKLLDPIDKATLVELRTSHYDQGEFRGLQTVFPGSIHPSGEAISWASDGEPFEVDASELGDYARRLAAAALLARRWPGPGGRHDAALAVAGALYRAGWGQGVAVDFVKAICAATGDAEQEDRLRAVADTYANAPTRAVTGWRTLGGLVDLRAVRKAREWLGLGSAAYDEAPAAPAPAAATEPTPATPNAPTKTPPPGHDELRDRWLSDHPNTHYSLGAWWRYEAGIWRVVDEGAIDREISQVLEAAKSEGVRVTGALLSSVRTLARAKTYLPGDGWDANPDILVCQNGALHIPSGELAPHSPGHYATSAVAYAYSPSAEAPVWRYFINTLPAEVVPFLQEFAGYCLTTDTRHELAVWLYGPPGGGKSTFLTGLLAMLGRRAGRLSLRDVEQSRFALADLPGKTLVVATEQPSQYVQTTDTLNAIISGEPVAAERKFKDPVTITPRAKLCWAMNALPRVPDAGDGLFRRVKVVHFEAIPEDARDPAVKDTIPTEGAGILLWALEGLARLRARGRFMVPAAVKDATEQFKATNDVPSLFIADRCVVNPSARVPGGELYAAYRAWCEGNGYRALASNNAAREWERLGFTSMRSNGRVYWQGLGLALEAN